MENQKRKEKEELKRRKEEERRREREGREEKKRKEEEKKKRERDDKELRRKHKVCRFNKVLCWNAWGGLKYKKKVGVLVVLVRGVNFRFWSHLGCCRKITNIFSLQGLA